jgi:hypothetical protein
MKLVFRNATQEDWPRLQELHREQQTAQGTKYELPDILSGHPFTLVIVGEDSAGVIQQCFYIEATAELRFIGCNPKATALSQREANQLCYWLKLLGFRWLECFVPKQFQKAIAKPLRRAGFTYKGKELAYFTRDMRGKP